MENRALYEKPRHEPADVIPLTQELALLDWLKSNDRLIPRDDSPVLDESKPREDSDIDLILEEDNNDSFDDDSSSSDDN